MTSPNTDVIVACPGPAGVVAALSAAEPGSALITTLCELGIDPAVGFHSIIPARGRETGDGIVPLASAHLEGSASELLIAAAHACLEEREVIRETARILAEHVRMSGKDSSCLALDVSGRRGETWDLGRSGGDTTAPEGRP